MSYQFLLPDVGEGVVEAELVKWCVAEGDEVQADQPVVEMMTDKATVVIPCSVAGRVQKRLHAEGDMVQIGAPLMELEGVEVAPDPGVAVAPEKPTPDPVKPVKGPEGPPPEPAPVSRPVTRQSTAAKVLAAPATRRLARSLNVDLASVPGSGPAGRITAADVTAFATQAALNTQGGAERASSPAARPEPSGSARAPHAAHTTHTAHTAPTPASPTIPVTKQLSGKIEQVPVRGLKRRMWESMSTSAFTAAHFTYFEECDCTGLVETRKRFQGALREGEPKLNYLPFVAKAVIAALKRFPQLNGIVDEEKQAFMQHSDVHLGIAVATDSGLIVPVVHQANRLSVLELAQEIQRLAQGVREKKITAFELKGSTFTITSLGKEGGLAATPIINYPEVAILGVHRMAKRVFVDENDEIGVRPMMNLSLSFDHRLIDGQTGAKFANTVIDLLERPERLFLES